jgi:transmembrane sensor
MRITDDILIKFLLNESSAEESTAVRQWMDEDSSNREHYAQIEHIWTSSKKLAKTSEVDEEKAWMKFQQRVSTGIKSNQSEAGPQEVQQTRAAVVRPLNPGFRWIRIAAVFVLIVGAVLINKYMLQGSYTEVTALQQVLIQTLPDGSEITLNKNSNLSYASNFKKDRSIRLEKGEAFFKVTPDKKHPFIIEAHGVSVEVVGTSFNVKHLNDTTEVIVETGIVKVSLGKEKVELKRGEKVLITAGTSKLLKQQNTDQLYNFYQSKILIAANTPLVKIAEALNKTYDTNVTFKNAAVGQLTLTTTFKDQSLDQIVDIICETLNLTAEHKPNQIILSDKP